MRYLDPIQLLPRPLLGNRWLAHGAVLISSVALTGCPQILNDDFSVAEEAAFDQGGANALGSRRSSASSTTARSLGSGGSGGLRGDRPTNAMGSSSASSQAANGAGAASSATGGAAESVGGHAATSSGGSDTRGETTRVESTGLGGASTSSSRAGMDGGSSNSGGSSALGASSSSGGTSATATTSAAAGSPAEVTDCGNKVVLHDPLLASFDAWDGVSEPAKWRFPFNGSTQEALVTGTLESYTDGSGQYALEFVTGAAGTPHAIRAANPRASRWGGGVRLLLHCFDASAYKGMSFWISGSTPAKTVVVALGLDDQSADYQLEIPARWTQIRIPFTQFRGWGSDKPGKAIQFVDFSSQLLYSTQGAIEGAYEIVVDEVGFY